MIVRTSGCLWNICVDGEESQLCLIDLDVIQFLVPLLNSTEDQELLNNCSMVLSLLGALAKGSQILIQNDGFKSCLRILSYDDDLLRNTAASVLWNLGHIPENKEELVKHNVGKNLSNFLDSKDTDTVEKALGATLTLCSNIEIGKQFKKAEGFDKLIPFIENRKYEVITEYSIICIAVLAIDEENKNDLREAGAIGPLIDILKSENPTLIEKSLIALMNLSLNPKNRTAIRQLDGIPPLIDLLFHDNPKIQQNAAGVLWNLCNDERCKKLIREMGALNALLSLISGGQLNPGDKKLVDDQRKNRDKIKKDDEDVASGKKKVDEELNINPTEVREDLNLFAKDLKNRLDLDDDLKNNITKDEKKSFGRCCK